MKKHIYLPLVALAFFLTACATPKMNTEDLKAEIDAARSGHYGRAMLHEELSEEDLETSNTILGHLEKNHYWISTRNKKLWMPPDHLHTIVWNLRKRCANG